MRLPKLAQDVDRHGESRHFSSQNGATTAAGAAVTATTLHPASANFEVESALAQDSAAILDGTSDIFNQQLLDWTKESAVSPTGGDGGFTLGGNLEHDWLFSYPFEVPDRNTRSGGGIENPSIRTSISTASGASTDPLTETLHTTGVPVANPTDTIGSEGTFNSTDAPSPNHDSRSSPSASTDWLSSEMLNMFETVEVCLAWGLQKSSSTGSNNSGKMTSLLSPLFPTSLPSETLSCQKEVLRTCDKWLSLDAHLLQARHAVMMVSIFDTLFSSLESMANASSSSSQHDDVSHSLNKGGGIEAQRWKHIRNGSVSPPAQRDNNNRPCKARNSALAYMAGGTTDWSTLVHDAFEAELGSPLRQQASTSQLWNPQDDGEGAHVLRSILNFRAAQIKRLLERLWTIAMSSQWQAQTYMVRRLLDRVYRRRDLM